MNLLAANVNWPSIKCSGSGIYSGRSGALDVFVSATPKSKLLIAKVPVEPPTVEHRLPLEEKFPAESSENQRLTRSTSDSDSDEPSLKNIAGQFLDYFKTTKTEKIPEEIILSQDDLSEFTVRFLNFTENLSQNGVVCNNGVCCNYTIRVNDNGATDGKV